MTQPADQEWNSPRRVEQSEMLQSAQLLALGLEGRQAAEICRVYNELAQKAHSRPLGEVWMTIASQILHPSLPFQVHVTVRDKFFGANGQSRAPLWYPSDSSVSELNIVKFIKSLKEETEQTAHAEDVEYWQREFKRLRHLTCHDPEFYWRHIIEFMHLAFMTNPEQMVCPSTDEDGVLWFSECEMNIADMALEKMRDTEKAIIWADEDLPAELCYMSGSEMKALSCRIGAAIASKYPSGTSIAVYLPMTAVAVCIYLGIVLAGCVVVSIADSFATPEVKTRLRIADTKVVFTQDVIKRAGKALPLYRKIATTVPCVVFPENLKTLQEPLSDMDVSFDTFLNSAPVTEFEAVVCDGYAHCNILFSSGTTGTPKAIPWTHLTPLKCGVDGMFGQNIHSESVVCWPTNLGWMMGPWLMFAAFLNKAPIALFQGSPVSSAFCKFVETAEVTMLGVIPSIVRGWKAKNMTQGCDWHRIQCFSSTGEASSYDEYHWLMAQAGYKPVIEYCGGTEIGGAYITGSMLHPQTPSGFSTPVLGSQVVVLEEDGVKDITDADSFEGELAIVPPMLGLSQMLLNRDHVEVYYQGMPRYGPHNFRLRRHGDVFMKAEGVYYSRGRSDDTMNLGGIKVGCVELEYAVMKTVKDVKEAAAVGFSPSSGGPEELALFLVLNPTGSNDVEALKQACQRAIKEEINPLFKVVHVQLRDNLPRTDSNKITRKVLREELRRAIS